MLWNHDVRETAIWAFLKFSLGKQEVDETKLFSYNIIKNNAYKTQAHQKRSCSKYRQK